MKKAIVPMLAASLLAGTVFFPSFGYAGKVEDIQKQLSQIQQQESALAQKKADADKQKSGIQAQKNQEQHSLDSIRQNIAEQGAKLNELNQQVNEVALSLQQAGAQLEDAENRVAERDKMMKSRIRLMYMNGNVSILDVLFDATSFSDFLDRYYAMQSIVGQDKTILDANQKDRDLVAQKKQEIENKLKETQTLVAQAEDIKQNLLVQEKEKQVAIASLSKKEQDDEDMVDNADQAIVAILKQKRQLMADLEKAKSADSPRIVQPAYAGGKLAWPVPSSSRITDVFGMRIDPIKKIRKLHKGVDIGAPNGTTIVAAEDGVILLAGWVNGYGNTVVIDHGGGLETWYGHIRDGGIKVTEGQHVKRGEKIAEVGSTGDSTGNHCHFEVRVNDEATDPMPYLR